MNHNTDPNWEPWKITFPAERCPFCGSVIVQVKPRCGVCDSEQVEGLWRLGDAFKAIERVRLRKMNAASVMEAGLQLQRMKLLKWVGSADAAATHSTASSEE